MPRIPDETPIDFLVRRKFGRTEWEGVFSPRTDAKAIENINKSIAQYRAELAEKTPEELKRLHEQEDRKYAAELAAKARREEEKLDFNQPSAVANYEHWTKCAHWTIDEAIALSFGRDPSVVRWETMQSMTRISSFAREYALRRDLARRAVAWKQLFDPVLPTIFLAWARQYQIAVPPELTEGVERFGGLIANWKDLHDKRAEIMKTQESTIEHLQGALESAKRSLAKQAQLIEQLQRERDDRANQLLENKSSEVVDGKERTSVAALVLGMALSKYRHDPEATRSGTASMIASDLARYGIAITDETVRKWLNEAKEKVTFKRPGS